MNKVVKEYPLVLLLYPSVPFFSIGWGSNMPFFFISIIFILQSCTFKIHKSLLLFICSGLFVILASLINYYIFEFVNYTQFFLGIRFLGTNFIIFWAIFLVFKRFKINNITSYIFVGIYLNFVYGFFELLYPKLPLYDKIFHNLGKSVYQDYFLVQTERIRMLWTEPSFAGVYLTSFVLPMILFKNKNNKLIIIFFLFLIFVAPKGSIIMLVFSFIIASVVTFYKHTSKLILTFILSILSFLLIRFIGAYYSFGVFKNLDHILVFCKNFLFGLFTEEKITLYESILSSGIGGSQLIRLHNIKIHLELLISNLNILIFGSSSFGNKLYVNELSHSELDIIPGYPMSYNSINEMYFAKDSTGSDFLNYYFWYGLPIVIFIFCMLFMILHYGLKYFQKEKKVFYFYVIYSTIILNLFFLLSYHSLPMFFVLFLYFKFKCNASFDFKGYFLLHEKP